MSFKNPVRTSKRTPHFTITKINWLTLFKFNSHSFVYFAANWVTAESAYTTLPYFYLCSIKYSQATNIYRRNKTAFFAMPYHVDFIEEILTYLRTELY
jgi:hypothetical protein